MNKLHVLDCTLRDGGYCNKWNFKEKNISKIMEGLVATKVDIVECGFLTQKVIYNKNITKYTQIQQLNQFIPCHDENMSFVVMMNIGEYDVDDLPDCKDTKIDGIRIAFHKSKMCEIENICKIIDKKGYKLFLQPMVTMLYTDDEYINLIKIANEIKPYAFYIVDSFGNMKSSDLYRYCQIIEKYLDKDILVGLHLHNNLQLALSNACLFVENMSERSLIVDSSISGMGRGAGNLNTELFISFANNYYKKDYEIKPILKIMDEVISFFYNEKPWGYSLPNYLSAVNMIHPNYAKYLTEKSSLMLEDIDDIFSMMEPNKKFEFDETYISNLYYEFMSKGAVRDEHIAEIKAKVKGKKVLLLAPGKSISDYGGLIKKFINDIKPIVICINYDEPDFESDYIFISNIRRFYQLDKKVYYKTISTSNIKTDETYASVDYYSLLNGIDAVKDNAGLMAIKYIIEELDVECIYIAGLDGYKRDLCSNYELEEMMIYMSEEMIEKRNNGIQRILDNCRNKSEISFITPTIFR